MTVIIGLKVSNRVGLVEDFQRILTKYGCDIKTRLGMHDVVEDESVCSNEGIILLEVPKSNRAELLSEELEKLKDVTIQKMKF